MRVSTKVGRDFVFAQELLEPMTVLRMSIQIPGSMPTSSVMIVRDRYYRQMAEQKNKGSGIRLEVVFQPVVEWFSDISILQCI